jgi:hypothetical protein
MGRFDCRLSASMIVDGVLFESRFSVERANAPRKRGR